MTIPQLRVVTDPPQPPTLPTQLCPHCVSFAKENEHLTDEVSGLLTTTRKMAAEKAALVRELNKIRRSDPASKDIEFVLTRWKRLCGHPGAKTPPDGKRWRLVKRALAEYGTLEEILEAIEGMALAPFMDFGKRAITGSEKDRRNDIEHALSNETRFEDCRSVTLRARNASVEQLNLAHIQAMATELIILRELQQAHARRDTQWLLIEQSARRWHYSRDDEEEAKAA